MIMQRKYNGSRSMHILSDFYLAFMRTDPCIYQVMKLILKFKDLVNTALGFTRVLKPA